MKRFEKAINNGSMRCFGLFMGNRVVDFDTVSYVDDQNQIVISKKLEDIDDPTVHAISVITFKSDLTVDFECAFFSGDDKIDVLHNHVNSKKTKDDILEPQTSFDFLIAQFMGFNYRQLKGLKDAVARGFNYGYWI